MIEIVSKFCLHQVQSIDVAAASWRSTQRFLSGNCWRSLSAQADASRWQRLRFALTERELLICVVYFS